MESNLSDPEGLINGGIMDKNMKLATLTIVAAFMVCAVGLVVYDSGLEAEDPPRTQLGTYFHDDTGITFTLYSDMTAQATSITAPPKDLVIPGTVSSDGKEYTVTEIGMRFAYRDSILTSVTIPASVTSMGGGLTKQPLWSAPHSPL